ncbi:group III truncated hemoglobin [Sneathiella sp.]|uniref:group III truncated hemoglobin n=1 Tax=Sneathiella sp. TaxID=1964365 RepID=UPI003567EEF3
MTAVPQRVAITAEITERTGIDTSMIENLVHTFYGHVRDDNLLAPIFDARVKDWDAHLQQMCRFWSSVALMSGEYQGQPMGKHIVLPIDARHFDRWLALFKATARTVCPEAAADHFIDRARRIAASFELAVAGQHNVLLPRGARFTNDALDCGD